MSPSPDSKFFIGGDSLKEEDPKGNSIDKDTIEQLREENKLLAARNEQLVAENKQIKEEIGIIERNNRQAREILRDIEDQLVENGIGVHFGEQGQPTIVFKDNQDISTQVRNNGGRSR